MNALLLVNKPKGITSSKVVIKLKKHFKLNKIGHSGTLDPLATGLLVIGIGEGTKVLDTLLNADKCYEATAQLGIITDSYDTDGHVISKSPPIIPSDQDLVDLTHRFTGQILQTPPMVSAIKINGKALYRYAKEGKNIEIPQRKVCIHSLDISTSSHFLKINMHCSKGTYVRSLVHDIGQVMGCGATVSSLHRTQLAHFNVMHAHALEDLLQLNLDQLKDKTIKIQSCLPHHFRIELNLEQAIRLFHGKPIHMVSKDNSCLFYFNDTLLAIGSIKNNNVYIDKRLSMSWFRDKYT